MRVFSHVARASGRPSARSLCTSAAARVLGVAVGAPRSEIKKAYYELAKATHPDAVAAASASSSTASHDAFLAIQSAFEEMMNAPEPSKRATSAARSAPGSAPRQARTRRPVARSSSAKPPTLGEILCERLEEEPSALFAVWDDIKEQKLEVTSRMTSALFKACSESGDGMPTALAVLREATALQMLSQTVRSESLVSLLTWCKEEHLDTTFDVVDEIQECDRTPEVLAALSATFSYFPSGASF
jgi:curved DNA-binding protein CbpA